MKPITLALLLTLSVFPATPPVAAQNAPTRYQSLTFVTVRPGQEATYQDFVARVRAARETIDYPQAVSIVSMRMGGPPNQYVVVSGFEAFGEVDAWSRPPGILAHAYGEEEARTVLAEGRATVESVENVVMSLLPEFSSGMDRPPEGNFVHVVTTDVDPREIADYQAMLTALAAEEEDRGMRVIRWTTRLGSSVVYEATRRFESLADLDTWTGPPQLLEEAYGEAGRQLWERSVAAIRNRTLRVVEIRDDLSYEPN